MTPAEWDRWAIVFMRSSWIYPLIGARWIGPVVQVVLARHLIRRMERFAAREASR